MSERNPRRGVVGKHAASRVRHAPDASTQRHARRAQHQAGRQKALHRRSELHSRLLGSEWPQPATIF